MKKKSQFKYMVNINWSEEDQAYVAEVPELPGCATHGSTYEKAVRNAEDAIETWLSGAKESKYPIPEPLATKYFSGKFVARLNPPLHRYLTLKASQKKKSLNRFVEDILKDYELRDPA